MAQTINNTNLDQFRAESQRVMQQNRQHQAGAAVDKPAVESTKQYADNVTLGEPASPAGLYRADMSTTEDPQLTLLRSLVLQIFEEQGLATKLSMGDTSIDIKSLTPGQAQELVAEDGYFGVEQTSERIFKGAIGIAGGDATRLDAILKGVEKGFAEAEKAFGGTLPEISYKTREAVLEKLNNWAESNSPG
ncbi:MAG: hypothetical protein PHH87_03250 [Desulfuromonas sp.]|jgi:hypothetical protein|nr:hypothetical protein [Desulfuromonas sp.]